MFGTIRVKGHGFIQVGGEVAVGNEIGGLGLGHLDAGPQNDAGQPHATNGGPEQVALGVVGGALRLKMQDPAVGNQQFHRHHMVTEGAGRVVVLTVNVGANGATNGHLAGARQHRNPQAIRQGGLHQLVKSDTTIHVDNGGLRVDGVNVIHRLHVNDQAASVLGRVAIGAAHAPGDHTPLEVVGFIGVGFCHQGNRTSNLFHVRGGKHLGGGGGSAAPTGEFLCGCGKVWTLRHSGLAHLLYASWVKFKFFSRSTLPIFWV